MIDRTDLESWFNQGFGPTVALLGVFVVYAGMYAEARAEGRPVADALLLPIFAVVVAAVAIAAFGGVIVLVGYLRTGLVSDIRGWLDD